MDFFKQCALARGELVRFRLQDLGTFGRALRESFDPFATGRLCAGLRLLVRRQWRGRCTEQTGQTECDERRQERSLERSGSKEET